VHNHKPIVNQSAGIIVVSSKKEKDFIRHTTTVKWSAMPKSRHGIFRSRAVEWDILESKFQVFNKRKSKGKSAKTMLGK
jgi:hypothetical protein